MFPALHRRDTNHKAHHIASEQKRRGNIRSEFDKIVKLTPSLSDQESRSELTILNKSANYIEQLRVENAKLVELCKQQGIEVPPDMINTGPGPSSE